MNRFERRALGKKFDQCPVQALRSELGRLGGTEGALLRQEKGILILFEY
jgi:hypothetical protein